MKKTVCLIAFGSVMMMLVACGFVKGKGEAEKIAESLFEERIGKGQFDSDLDRYYSELFWKNVDDKKWSDIKKLVKTAMGDLKSYVLITWNVQSKVDTNEISGTIVVLVYETTYENGLGTETLTIHKSLTGDTFAILGHHFNSEQIQELINKGIEQVASSSYL